MTSALFPDLQVVPLDTCVLHEETDAKRVTRLVERLTSDRILRNPPILGRHNGLEPLIVLDGATRVTALRELGAPHVVAQVVDYDNDIIQLHTWSHILAGMTLDELSSALAHEELLSVRTCSLHDAEVALMRRETLAYLADRSGQCLALYNGTGMVEQATALRQLFAIYATRAGIARVPPTEWRMRLEESEAGVAVVFPVHTKNDLVVLASANAVLPAGITRHVIPGRALRINVPLERLCDDQPFAEKQAWLDTWLREHQTGHGVRYYAEPTFLFDE